MGEIIRVDDQSARALNWLETTELLSPGSAPILVRSGVDNSVHWQAGQRFEHIFEARADVMTASNPKQLAVDGAEGKLTYAELDARANQLARYLKRQGLGSGDRIALLFDKSIFSYIATLAVLKMQAAYVPLDASFPADRIAFIAEDAHVSVILSLERFRDHLAATSVGVLHVDGALDAIAAERSDRLSAAERGALVEDLAYIIYTSGSTGKPKGVPIDHPQIVNFVNVASETYGIRSTDRIYQGLTIAFDFAVEEIWVPLAVGATLVPGPVGSTLVGADLGAFLSAQHVTALCCVPTLLATLEADLPELRYIMVSGEACPQDLVARWQRPGRRFLNAYGPTEATVTATLNEMVAGKPVTIGKPLPTYAIVILDPAEPTTLAFGETGEIGIAGIGVAKGYLNRDELTQKVFIPDFLDVEHNTSGRIYRTGDLGRVNADGDVEYMGRIDTQVKIRGYRIELTEIESVLMQHPDIAQAVVNKYEPEPGTVELAAYFTRRPGADDFDLDALVETLKQSVPRYMVPAYFTELDAIPLLPSHKADRKKLPKPEGRYMASRAAALAPAAGLETDIANALCAALGVSAVSAEDHFFNDLGANSLLMARFCTKLRETTGIDLGMRDAYTYPTVRALAAQLTVTAPAVAPVEDVPTPHRASAFAFAMTGIAQAVAALVYLSALGMLGVALVTWMIAAHGVLELYGRVAAGSLAGAAALVLGPVAIKWLLVGRWTAETFPIWSAKYFRFWLVKQLIRANPMRAFAGTPLYNVYLRMLGARIGRNVLILANAMPVATDLISIGDDTVISKDSFMSGYRARAGRIEIGSVTIGARAFVGEATVLTINTAMGDDTQLGNSSSLQPGQSVPDGKRYHGSPAIETTTNYARLDRGDASLLRRFSYGLFQLVGLFGLLIPAPVVALTAIWPQALQLMAAETAGPAALPLGWGQLALLMLVWSLAAYIGVIILGLVTVAVVPRLAYLFLTPGKTYRLYGLHYFLLRTVTAFSNSKSLNALFGDSSYITSFLGYVGWNLGKVVQMGSNFGSMQKHDVPFLSRIGSGTMVSDGLSMINAEMSATSFKLAEATIGANNFLGNMVFYPAGGRTGDNVLLATKVLIPLDGEIRQDVGLLGSPSFEIPRTVKRDTAFDHMRTGEEFERRLRAKNRSNIVTAVLFLFTRWLFVYLTFGLLALAIAVDEVVPMGVGFALATLGTLAFGAVYFALLERLTLGFKKLEAKYVSIYDPYYWHHELHWKLSDNAALMAAFNGTPFKALAWRAVGVKVGKRLFDDGCGMTERSLVELGDYVTLGEGSTLQSHTMEDATFKSDLIRIGNGVSIGSNAYINYGVDMGDNSLLAADSFLMKGTIVDGGAVWSGNPARQLRA